MILESRPSGPPSVILLKILVSDKVLIVVAWPLLIGGSALLALMEYGKMDLLVNRFLSPLTKLLGLPLAVGTTLIFGLLRKELS